MTISIDKEIEPGFSYFVKIRLYQGKNNAVHHEEFCLEKQEPILRRLATKSGMSYEHLDAVAIRFESEIGVKKI